VPNTGIIAVELITVDASIPAVTEKFSGNVITIITITAIIVTED
jgi:hypothetical protein